MTKEEG